MVKRLVIAIMLFFFASALIACPLAAAEKKEKGKLESFQEEVDKPSHETSEETRSLSASDIAVQGAFEAFMYFLLAGLAQGGSENMGDLYKELKEEWSPALPTFRVEPGYQYVFDGIHGLSAKAEAGYLTFGVDAEYLRYYEKEFEDLTIVNGHLLLRSLFAKVVGLNLALGVKSFFGQNQRVGFELGLPLYVYINKHFILDVLPYMAFVHGHYIYDVAGGLSYKYKLIGVRAAYRAVKANDQTLHGPYVGAFIQW